MICVSFSKKNSLDSAATLEEVLDRGSLLPEERPALLAYLKKL